MAKKVVFGLLALLLGGLVVYTSLNTGDTYAQAGGVVSAWVNEHFFASQLDARQLSALSGFGGKFVGHFLLFLATGLFSALFLSQYKEKHALRVAIFLCYGLVLASLGEVIQIFVPGRNPALGDVILNFWAYTSLPTLWLLYKRY